MYWNHILEEVKNKNNPNFPCYFTHIRDSTHKSNPPPPKASSKNKITTRYLINKNQPKLYLTQQEAKCIVHLLSGKTIKETGRALNLSHRTVEFYLNIVKKKCECKNKKQLLIFIHQSDFTKHINEIKDL